MIEDILRVEHDTEKGTYTVYYNGANFSMASMPRLDVDYDYSRPGYMHDPFSYYMNRRYRVSFDCFEMPLPPSKPKRSVARHLGLRRPK